MRTNSALALLYTDLIPCSSSRTNAIAVDEQVKMFNQFVVSTRIRAARNVSGFALPAGTDDEDRKGVREVNLKTRQRREDEFVDNSFGRGGGRINPLP